MHFAALRFRAGHLAAAALGALLITPVLAQSAGSVTGTWEMDTAKSQVADGRTMVLSIEQAGDKKLKLVSTTHPKSGSDLSVEITCTSDGKECEFAEGKHKSHVSMWFVDHALNVCKTDGPEGDVVNQWKVEPSGDGKQLTVTVTHIDPTAADEVLVFTRKG